MYDSDFDMQIRLIHPQWFLNTAYENKKKILNYEIGCKTPKEFRKCLYQYTYHKTKTYDKTFDELIRMKQPQWFKY